MSTCKDSRVKEYRDVMGLFLSNYAFNAASCELLDMRYFMC